MNDTELVRCQCGCGGLRPLNPKVKRKPKRSKRWAARSASCHYCGKPAESWDHVIPASRGGSNAAYNLVPSCCTCNNKKADRMPSCDCDTCWTAITAWQGRQGWPALTHSQWQDLARFGIYGTHGPEIQIPQPRRSPTMPTKDVLKKAESLLLESEPRTFEERLQLASELRALATHYAQNEMP